jgi:hypothetical protein
MTEREKLKERIKNMKLEIDICFKEDDLDLEMAFYLQMRLINLMEKLEKE